mgnify:CR=1 FL=1
MKISQGLLRDFYDPNYCSVKWDTIYNKGHRFPPTDAMINGLVFEQLVIGESRGGEIYEIPKLKNGKVSKRESDIIDLSNSAKKVMKSLDIKLLDVQPEWEVDNLSGHPDALIEWKGEKCIFDLKFTGTKEDDSCKFNPYAWGKDLEYKDFSQAIHYVEMYYRMYGEYLPFFYLVFGKSGWVKFINVDISSESMNNHRKKINQFENDIKDFIPKKCDNFRCEYCKHEKPNLIIVNT